MITLIWTFWVLHQFMIVIILLNFLIAVLSQSYEMVMSKASISTYLHRCELNMECLRVLAHIGQLQPINMFTIACADSHEGDEGGDEWLGFVSEVKKFIDKNNKQLKVNQTKRMDQLSEEIQHVQNHFKNSIDSVKFQMTT